MQFEDIKDKKDLEEWLKVSIRNQVKTMFEQGGYIKSWPAKVSSVGTGVASVTLEGDTTHVIPNLKNKTGLTLNVGDEVMVISRNSQLGNAFIAWKK